MWIVRGNSVMGKRIQDDEKPRRGALVQRQKSGLDRRNVSRDVAEYIRVLILEGEIKPFEKVPQDDIADELGVSRIPVRESLRRMVGQGLLTSAADGGEIRMRQYTPDEVRQLYEFREVLEGEISRLAARAASDTDISRLKMICDESETVIGTEDGQRRWGELDHAFHEALADASHNQRMADSLKNLLTECHYLFYIFPAKAKRKQVSRDETAAHMHEVLEEEHRELLKRITERDADGAQQVARNSIREGGRRLIEAMIASQLED